MKITETKCKSALSKSNLPGLDYSLNPYRGCQHKCAYCYVPNVLRIKRAEWGNYVNVKTNIPNILAKELKKKKRGIVALSTVTDPISHKFKGFILLAGSKTILILVNIISDSPSNSICLPCSL